VTDPLRLRASHDAWWSNWWDASVLDLLPAGTVCPPGAVGGGPDGCIMDGFLTAMDWMRGAVGQEGGVVPSLWGPFNNLDPAGWRDDVTIE